MGRLGLDGAVLWAKWGDVALLHLIYRTPPGTPPGPPGPPPGPPLSIPGGLGPLSLHLSSVFFSFLTSKKSINPKNNKNSYIWPLQTLGSVSGEISTSSTRFRALESSYSSLNTRKLENKKDKHLQKSEQIYKDPQRDKHLKVGSMTPLGRDPTRALLDSGL